MLKFSKSLHFQNSNDKNVHGQQITVSKHLKIYKTIFYRNTSEHKICINTETEFFINEMDFVYNDDSTGNH